MAIEIKYQPTSHKGKDVIFIRFEHNAELNLRVKKMVGVRWSQSEKAWYVIDSAFYRQKFGLSLKPPIGKEVILHIHLINQIAIQKYIETLQLKSYSQNTITTYRNEFAQLLYILKDKNVDELDANRLRDYFLYCTNTLKLSENTLHSRINAVKFYFEKILGRDKFFYEIPRPKRPLLLPNVLALSQVEKLFSKLENLNRIAEAT
jgi:integrase/recombinase XerD